MEAVHADWKEYLNLLICEENHLKHMDEYHKVCEYLNLMLCCGHSTKEGVIITCTNRLFYFEIPGSCLFVHA
jgi:hypothetical protein